MRRATWCTRWTRSRTRWWSWRRCCPSRNGDTRTKSRYGGCTACSAQMRGLLVGPKLSVRANNKSNGNIHCVLSLIGTGTREARPQCASVPVQWIERDAKAEWRAAKCEYLCCSVTVCHWGGETECKKWSKKTETKKRSFLPLFEAACCFSQLPPVTHNTNACTTFLFLPSHSTLQTLSPFPAAQEIRQLRMKQEGFVREISDLQETVEWKDKKIGVRLWARSFVL